MRLKYYPFTLNLKHTFTVSSYSRTTTPIVLTEVEHEGRTGYGEASLPPYLGESQDSVLRFLSKVNLSQFPDPLNLEDILNYVDDIEPGNNAAKASIDIALHDLVGKLLDVPLHKYFGLNKENSPYSSFTIGIDKPEMLIKKLEEASQFKFLKIKLGTEQDREIINTIRSVTELPLYIDANQGWKEKEKALELINWLKEKNVLLIEQPMPKEMIDETAWLTERSPLPIFADESVKRLADLIKFKDVFSGVNIKLMKSAGLREANKMITLARSFGMQVMLGCMTETSCAVSAAAQLAPLASIADLDGNLLISNDVFKGMTINDGKIILNNLPGIGVKKIEL